MSAVFNVDKAKLSALKEIMVTINFRCKDGKNKQITFYGKEVDTLIDQLNEATKWKE